MKSKFKIYGIYMIAYLLLLPTFVALGAIACINHLGSDGYFIDTTIANIAGFGLAAASIFLLSYIPWASKKFKFIPSFTSPLNYGPCAVMSAALIFIAVHLLIESGILSGSVAPLPLIVGILALLSVLYFVMSAISVKRRSIMRSDFGIIVLIFLCAYVAYIFFDTGAPINAPIKTATMMSFLSFSLFFLYETRLSLGREKWHFYVAFAFISSIMSAYASIPALITYIIKDRIIGISIYETILVFALFIFSTFKLFLVGELVPERGSNVVNKLIESATDRINELKPVEPTVEIGEEPDENQFSILDEKEKTDEQIEADVSDASDNSLDTDENDEADTNSDNFTDNSSSDIINTENLPEDTPRVTEIDTQFKESGTESNEETPKSKEADKADAQAYCPDEGNTALNTESKPNNDTRVTFSDKKDSSEE